MKDFDLRRTDGGGSLNRRKNDAELMEIGEICERSAKSTVVLLQYEIGGIPDRDRCSKGKIYGNG